LLVSVTRQILDFNPPYLFPDYEVSVSRAPEQALIALPENWFDRAAGPAFGRIEVRPHDNDLTCQGVEHPIGQRICVSGRVLDSDGRGVPGALLEIWQANAAGRYMDAAAPEFFPVDANFTGAGRCLTGNDGNYRFTTIRPGAYSAGPNYLFRPAHIHFSILGPLLAHRLVTQMYFPDDPLQDRDPIFQSVPDPRGRRRLVGEFVEARVELDGRESALYYQWDIVLRGHRATPMES
jgi:protocatechuate 3,4-dioxygenase beta subunit